MRNQVWTAAALALVCLAGRAVADVASGLERGASVPAFYVRDVTGPSKGEELCYRCKYGSKPVVAVFAKEMTDEVASLVKELDGVVGKNADQKMAGFVVVMAEDPDKSIDRLESVAKTQGIKHMPLTTFYGTAGPKGYKISEKADITVMMWVDSKVKVSQGFNKGELKADTIKKVVSETKQILD